MTTPKDLREDNIFLKKLVSYHEKTIAELQQTVHTQQTQIGQMTALLKASQEKLVQLEQEKLEGGNHLRNIMAPVKR